MSLIECLNNLMKVSSCCIKEVEKEGSCQIIKDKPSQKIGGELGLGGELDIFYKQIRTFCPRCKKTYNLHFEREGLSRILLIVMFKVCLRHNQQAEKRKLSVICVCTFILHYAPTNLRRLCQAEDKVA